MFTPLKVKDPASLLRRWAGLVQMKDAACIEDLFQRQAMARTENNAEATPLVCRVLVADSSSLS